MSSRSERFDRGDFSSRYRREQVVAADTDASPLLVVWPVKQPRIGQTVMADRNGKGRPHKGVDLFVKAGSPVVAAVSGKVVRVVDGRESADEGKRRAGLWIDTLADSGLIFRYLHLGSVRVREGQRVKAGQEIATVADRGESGSGQAPHLHLEIRRDDFRGSDYGEPIDPLPILKGLA